MITTTADSWMARRNLTSLERGCDVAEIYLLVFFVVRPNDLPLCMVEYLASRYFSRLSSNESQIQ